LRVLYFPIARLNRFDENCAQPLKGLMKAKLAASLKRCPDTKLEFFSTLCSCGLELRAPRDYFRTIISAGLFPRDYFRATDSVRIPWILVQSSVSALSSVSLRWPE